MMWQRREILTETERLVLLADCASDALNSSGGGGGFSCDVDTRRSSSGRGTGETRGLNFVASMVRFLVNRLPVRMIEKTSSDIEEGNSSGACLRFVLRDARGMMTRHKRRSAFMHRGVLIACTPAQNTQMLGSSPLTTLLRWAVAQGKDLGMDRGCNREKIVRVVV